MREIKFRGRRIANGEWLYGDLYRVNEQVLIKPHLNEPYEYPEDYDENVDPETVGQYTGIKELYEDAIVRYNTGWNETIGIVRFGEYVQDGSGGEYSGSKCLGFYVERNTIIPSDWDIEMNDEPTSRDEEATVSIYGYDFETIGNIHEHPHLLKGEEQ